MVENYQTVIISKNFTFVLKASLLSQIINFSDNISAADIISQHTSHLEGFLSKCIQLSIFDPMQCFSMGEHVINTVTSLKK